MIFQTLEDLFDTKYIFDGLWH